MDDDIPEARKLTRSKQRWASDFLSADKAGFREVNGYHMRGDPWAEERYS